MRILSILFIVTLISVAIQVYLVQKQIDEELKMKSEMIATSIQEGINETKLASETIEHQIDLKMAGYASHIASKLNTNTAENVTTEQLTAIKEEMELSGLSIFARQGDDIVVVKSTDEKDIGFSTRNFGDYVYQASNALLNGEKPSDEMAFTAENLLVLPIAQSGSHDEKPLFFKYAYYHPPGADYFINPFIEAEEVYQFTEEAGPDQWIEKIETETSFLKEVSVLNPAVYQNPELEKQLYPPMKKVVFGGYETFTKEDEDILKKIAEEPVKTTSLQTIKGEKLFKMFIPTEDSHVVAVALDYDQIVWPLYRHSIILIVSGVIGLVILTLLTFRFFNRIYENIQKIIRQIKNIEEGDLTAKSNVKDGSELGELSRTANRMVDKLNELLADTQIQALKTQQLSNQLEKEASESVDRMYSISTEATIKSRDQLNDISEFLDETLRVLEPYEKDSRIGVLKESIEKMRQMALERTAAVTETTLSLSDLVQALHKQSRELSTISKSTIQQINKFKI
ncbi:HAMP domain-containing protein [Domibacillus enclensis]|nr:HAMP domain-containing protein [Domibacillus enclensis]